jgi:hypothetical protein
MSYQRTPWHEHDDDSDEDCMIAIGEARSEEDGQLASVSLFELGIPCELAYDTSKVNELRRFFGSSTAGQRLFVKPQDAARALAAIGPRLVPTEVWTDGTLYLEQRSTEELFRLLDFRTLWNEPVLTAAESVITARGLVYPPDGDCSRTRLILYRILFVVVGPWALLVVPNGTETRNTKEGGTRPRYNEKTRLKLEHCITRGLLTWVGLFIAIIVIGKIMVPVTVTPKHPQSRAPDIIEPRR